VKLAALAEAVGAKIATQGVSCDAEVRAVVAGDRVSDLLSHSDEWTLIVTNLLGPQLVKLAQLMDVPGVCLLGGADPGQEVLSQARSQGTVIVVSPERMFETCGKLYAVLRGSGGQR
jgi:hypothetical protein